ncbi:hypothetical protein [Wenling hepe-like virus 1]|uniref:hypothetical protein n=1 Tax=Wenling hepe-like virus 1 TaxID=1923493 RepID=UPI000909DABC|nr:hypothetical protein [Wenling hepe-like virus 1]APG77824.1 hypothetical protein [Wenling hepe-like virus 1]
MESKIEVSGVPTPLVQDVALTPENKPVVPQQSVAAKLHSQLNNQRITLAPVSAPPLPNPDKYEVEKVKWDGPRPGTVSTNLYNLRDAIKARTTAFERYEYYKVEQLTVTIHGVANRLTIRNLIACRYIQDPYNSGSDELWSKDAPYDTRNNGITISRFDEETMIEIPMPTNWLYTKPSADKRFYEVGNLLVNTAGGDGASAYYPTATISATVLYKVPTIQIAHSNEHVFVDDNWVFNSFNFKTNSPTTAIAIIRATPPWQGTSVTFTESIKVSGKIPIQNEDGTTTGYPVHFNFQNAQLLEDDKFIVNFQFASADLLDSDGNELDSGVYQNEGSSYWAIKPISNRKLDNALK